MKHKPGYRLVCHQRSLSTLPHVAWKSIGRAFPVETKHKWNDMIVIQGKKILHLIRPKHNLLKILLWYLQLAKAKYTIKHITMSSFNQQIDINYILNKSTFNKQHIWYTIPTKSKTTIVSFLKRAVSLKWVYLVV